LGATPFFPLAIDEVNAWLHERGPGVARRRPELELGDCCATWELAVEHPALDDTRPLLVLLHDFPAKPGRIVFSPALCLRLPHVEEDGNFCHGIEPQGDDVDAPKVAVGRVLERLDNFLADCVEPGWREAEFQKERINYWNRWVSRARRPVAFQATELLVDAAASDGATRELETILLAGDQKALATAASDGSESIAKARGWSVGTITRGKTLLIPMPREMSWTPATWPTTFAALDALASNLVGAQHTLTRWYRSTKWPNKAPVFVVLDQVACAFAWCLVPNPVQRSRDPTTLPVTITRVDREWALGRDRQPELLAQRGAKRVAVLGAGSLGSAVSELLARAGVGETEIIDPEDFESGNTSRHLLGMPDLGKPKAAALAARLNRNVPAVRARGARKSAAQWAASVVAASRPDLVIDCTGERAVRLLLSRLHSSELQGVPVVTGWMEPHGAAAHVVITTDTDRWPASDPTDTHINIAQWPDSAYVALPACGQGFHEYGPADAWAAASLIAEKALLALAAREPASGVWSRVRNRDFFEAAAPGVVFNREPRCPPGVECIIEQRSLKEALDGSR
jgi:hypothetical protein